MDIGRENGKESRAVSHAARFLLGALYVTVGLVFVGRHVHLGETDTTFYVKYAMEIANEGGLWGFLRSMFDGTFTLTNQHPLFPAIISLFQERSVDWFIHIKLLNLCIGFVFLWIFYAVVRRECGETCALLASGLLVANDIFMHQATMVSCEPLLLVFSTLGFYYIFKGLDDNRHWVAAGLFTGLAYMTKASGLFMVFGFGLFLLADRRLRFWELLKNKHLWLFLLMFIIVSLPLLVRNTIVHKFPFYNYNVQIIAMDEDWGKAARKAQFGDLLKKDPKEHLHRFVRGLGREFRILLHSLYSFQIHYLPKFTPDLSPPLVKAAAAVAAALLFALGVAGFVMSGLSRKKKLLLVLLFLGFYLPLSWYSINAPNRRYILPVSLFVLVFASPLISAALERCCRAIRERLKSSRPAGSMITGKAAISAFILVWLAATVLSGDVRNPFKSYRLEDGYHELAAYLSKNLRDGERYLKKGGHNYPWIWHYPELERKRVGRKYFKNIDSFRDFVRSNPDIRYLVINDEVFRMTKNIFSEYIRVDERRGFVPVKNVPGWTVVMRDEKEPADFLLLERAGRR